MSSPWLNAFAVAVGGAFGALGRYGLGALVEHWQRGIFPLATLLVNVSGSFLLGLLSASLFTQPGLPQWMRLAVGVGALGAFTTFSTFSVETVKLLAAGHSIQASISIAGNVFGCLFGAMLGFYCARWLS